MNHIVLVNLFNDRLSYIADIQEKINYTRVVLMHDQEQQLELDRQQTRLEEIAEDIDLKMTLIQMSN